MINIKEYDPKLPLFTLYVDRTDITSARFQLKMQSMSSRFNRSNMQVIILPSDKDEFVCTHSGFGSLEYKNEITEILKEYDNSPNSVQDVDDLISDLRSIDRKIKLDILEIN